MIKDEREDWQTCVYSGVSEDKHTIIDRDGYKVEYTGEDCLNYGDNESSVDDELGKNGRALIAQSAVPEDKSAEMFKLDNREICSQGGLHTFFTNDTNTDV